MTDEQFIIKIRMYGDKNGTGYTSFRTQIEREIQISATSPAKLAEAIAAMTGAAATELIDELIERDAQAEKETEE